MQSIPALIELPPEGERVFESSTTSTSWPLDTPGGRFFAEWETQTPVTREGQLMFFFQFLQAGGRWEQFMGGCPLSYTGNRGSGALNVMGTLLLSVLCGHWRYAHINSVRGDRINPALLGMSGTVSEDAVRAALKRMDETSALHWLQQQILASISPVLGLPWILDIDTTVKTLYGRQQGAQVGYNPHKHGRPSHNYHSYFVANLRISLGVEVRPGKEQSAAHGMPGLWQMLDGLPRASWPTFGRGDCGYGNEATMLAFEERALPYLFKLRHTPKVKILVQQLLRLGARWQDTGDGWEAIESSIKLFGWSKARRLVLVRESSAQAPVDDKAVGDKAVDDKAVDDKAVGDKAVGDIAVGGRVHRRRDPQALKGAQGKGWESIATPWSGKIAVLVTALDEQNYPTLAMPRLYRERSDAENVYDELKNQWGWNGYTTRNLAPSRIMANLVALVYNWWNLYVRFYDSEHHREAITSRPALMQGVGRQVQSGGQRTVKVTLLHEYREGIAAAVTLVSKQLHETSRITERWTAVEKWSLLLTKLLRRWLGGKWLPGLPEEAGLLLSG